MLDTLFSAPVRTGLFLLVAMAGGDCYATKFTLGPIDKAKVESSYCGKWQSQDGKTTVVISNFNDKEYLVQVTGDDNKTNCYAGFTVDIKDAHFAHLGPFTNDGKPPEDWILQRIELKDNQLVVRDLNKKYFDDKNPASADELRKLIEQHVNNDEIYDSGGGNVLTRVAE